jgi:hypothetical protein
MAKSYIVDLSHYLDARGALADMPSPALDAGLFFAAIVAWVTRHPGVAHERTNVPCRRGPWRRGCTVEVEAGLAPDGEAVVWCARPAAGAA